MSYNNYYDLLYGTGTGGSFPPDIVLQRTNAKLLHYINTSKYNPTEILNEQQMQWFGNNLSPINGSPLTSIVQAVSEISTIRAISDQNAKRAMNDAVQREINAEGKLKRWQGVGAIALGFVATIWLFATQAESTFVAKINALKLKMQGLGYPTTINVDNGWIYPDGNGCNMKNFQGGHSYMLEEMGIVPAAGYTAFEIAFNVWKLIRKPNWQTYELGSFTNSETINALMVQIRNDKNRGKIKSADRILIENATTGAVINPTVDELYYENFGSLTRTLKSTSTYQ